MLIAGGILMLLGWSGLCYLWGYQTCRVWFKREIQAAFLQAQRQYLDELRPQIPERVTDEHGFCLARDCRLCHPEGT